MKLITKYILINHLKYTGFQHSERNFELDIGEVYSVLCSISFNTFNGKSKVAHELID